MAKKSKLRTQSFRWQDPALTAVAAQRLSGLEFLQSMAAGKLPLPPIAVLMNVQSLEVEPGRVVFVATPGECHYNPIGMVHGGFAATLLDSAMACAVHSQLPLGQSYTTLEVKTHFVHAMTADTGPVRVEGEVLHLGNRVATAEGRILDRRGKLYAHGSTTCLVFPGGQSHG
ncbi:MAG: PaaI family thioesterase [Sinobacteraceae bacterium]|nr:PaaI family thioesterase [Nevskiaceae bacterium]